jgi:predicted ATPase/predicted negative regulator of RcsB-dependent stress response
MGPVSRSGLIGREAELEELARAVGKNRLVSMTGTPGVGKTALAAAFADSRPSVCCALLGVATADDTCRAVAHALALPHSASASTSSTAERIGRAIASRGKILVLLDDADLARAALVQLLPAWLRDAPGARFLVAARSRIGLPAAQRFELGPLDVPSARERDPAAIGRSSAVRLFARCGAAVQPGYRLTNATAQDVATIVRTLSGLPLAIELCASRIAVLGEREMAHMLAERLDALDGGSAAAGGRTLRGAFTLSWDQLAEEDARVLAACAVFRGSFDLDAATNLAARPRLETAEALERLEGSSLVRAFEPPEVPGARRYGLPRSVRVFASEHLTRDELIEASRRHAEHFGASAGTAKPPAPEVLALDRDELEAALSWAIEARKIAMAARVALALAPLALSRGPLVPFLERVDVLLEAKGLPRALSAELHLVRGLARIHHGRRDDALVDLAAARKLSVDVRVEVLAASKTGLVVGLKGRFSEARSHFEAAAARLDARSDPGLRGVVSKDLANVLSEEGRNDEAMVELARARDLFHVAGDLREEGFVLMMLGSRLVDEGQVAYARRDCTSALARLRAAGDHRSAGWCEVLLALIDGEEGNLLAARMRLDTALGAFRAVGDVHTEGLVLGYLGNVALEQGALADAETSYRDARVKLAEVGDRGSEALCAAAAGLVEVALGRSSSAADRFAHARELVKDDGRAARREAVEVLAGVLATKSRSPGTTTTTARAEEVRFALRAVAKVRAMLNAPRKAKKSGATERVLVIAADGSWLRAPSGRLARFASGGALHGILKRLAQERIRYPGRPTKLGTLVRAGWPGESILPGAAKNRLHVAIARLRRAGLDSALLHDEDGYLLDPAVPTRFAEDGERPSA